MGDYDLKILDIENRLVGPLDDRLIDADRRVRERGRDGFPDWWLFSVVIRQEPTHVGRLQDWMVAFAHSMDYGRQPPPEEVITVAAWIAFHKLTHPADIIIVQPLADALGVHRDVLIRVYRRIHSRMLLRLDYYTHELKWAYISVLGDEKRIF